MSDNKCDKCNKLFSCKSSLILHQKSSKSCGTDKYDCYYCPKKFTQKNSLDYHLINSCEEKKNSEKQEYQKKIDALEKKLEDQDRIYEKLRNEAQVKETMYEKQIEDLKKTVESLHEKMLQAK